MQKFKDDISHRPLVVSNKSTNVIVRALVAAHHVGAISDTEYRLTYAEVCEIGYAPQAFGGGPVDPDEMERWKSMKSWVDFE